jgi:aspartyl-tRNA(Asn)/glutamyl-tRNA(Gln) amidotransferase subunit C
MSVTRDEIKRISRLANIKVDGLMVDALCKDLSTILAFVEQLNQVDCSDVAESHMPAEKLPERADVATQGDSAVMDNAPQKECNMFVVPKVIG